jgi:hypothetical protein
MSFLFDRAAPVSAVAAPQDSPSPIEVDRALIALVRLLARQAVHGWLAQTATTEDGDTDAPSLSSAVSAGERR